MTIHSIVSVSSGKDSTSTLLVAIALEAENLQADFAGTSNEHVQTYEYLDYLERVPNTLIRRIKAASACSCSYGLCDSEWELIDEDAA